MTKARDIASATTPNANAALLATFPHRNLIINGAGQIDQRGLGTITGVTNTLQRHIDRWFTQLGSGATISTGASTDVPSGQGFTNSINATVTSAGSMSASYIFIQQIIEGYNIKTLQAATGIKTFTVSFWVKSSVTGIYTVSTQSSNYDFSYNGTYTVDAANTWEYKTVTVPATTNGTWNYTNTAGLNLRMCLGSSGGGTANTWVSGSHNGATTAVDWANNASATFYITGIQIELGSTATPFEHRSIGDELAACQRYYAHLTSFVGPALNSSAVQPTGIFPKQMRGSPTYGTTGVINISDNYAADHTQSSAHISVIANNTDGSPAQFLYLQNFSGLTTGRMYFFPRNNANNNRITLDAEL